MSKLDSANATSLPSRRLFLTRATAGLAGGLVTTAALAAPALAALPAAPVAETPDPIIALAEQFLEGRSGELRGFQRRRMNSTGCANGGKRTRSPRSATSRFIRERRSI